MCALRQKIYVVINPVSGAKSKKDIPEMLNVLDARRFDIHNFITSYPGHATQIAAQAVKDQVPYVIAAGGDGTINEIARVLIGTNTTLGIIPCGSGNGLARDLHISMDFKEAIETIRQNYVTRIDYGVANGMVFFCTCGVGFDAAVSQKVLKQANRGKLMYVKSMLEVLMTYDPETYVLEYAEGSFNDKAFLITCANASQYGNNGYIAPHANISDGKMNIAVMKPFPIIDAAKTAIQLLSKNISNNVYLEEILTDEAVIRRSKPGTMHLDGNSVQTDADVHVKIIHKGLKVIVPKHVPQTVFDTAQDFFTNITRWL